LQASVVHGLPSVHTSAGPPTHAPLLHWSKVVQASPSLQLPGAGTAVHPELGSQASAVHGLPSLHSKGVPPTQAPAAQVSPCVQALPSLHGAPLGVLTQPDDGLQASLVHGLPSSHATAAPPPQAPPAQNSPEVQGFESSHGAALLVVVQPDSLSQPSSVQGLPSLHASAGPPTQLPAKQLSSVVHALPSSQGPLAGWVPQPLAELHTSFVQGFPSSHTSATPPVHAPSAHTSPVVQALSSSHAAELAA
jgi:hypothetical protein